MYYINVHVHVALSGNPTLHSVTQHLSLSAPEVLGDCHIVGFGEKGAGRKLFGHERMKVIMTNKHYASAINITFVYIL